MGNRIRHFTAANPGYMTLEGTNQYLLGKDEITVVDVALSSRANLDGIIEQAAAMGGKIEKILLTHIHSDHCGGALALKKRSGAKLGVSRLRAGYVGGEDFTYGDDDEIPYDGGRLKVVHTPGHESGHCCFYEPELRDLLTGDHILGRGTTVIPPPDGDMARYIQSLEKLLGLKMRRLLPGHGPVVEDPYGKIREYIDHRMLREKMVLNCLRQGDQTISAITARIYTDTPAALQSVAQLSVEAHLIKLINEKRVRREGGRYILAPGT
ncbi:MAG TPA: MBL fold metallo-hydrolase [Candidatus Binatia bacterium]|jgi:glyoxylase-like metal-dependent hydrolase (beta-lactamase superfamily II)